MVTIDCPWCTEEVPLAFAPSAEAEVEFCCPECGTSVAIVDEPVTPLDLAA